jgi:hypothetical protein
VRPVVDLLLVVATLSHGLVSSDGVPIIGPEERRA